MSHICLFLILVSTYIVQYIKILNLSSYDNIHVQYVYPIMTNLCTSLLFAVAFFIHNNMDKTNLAQDTQ